MTISGQIVDILERNIFPGRVHVVSGRIISIEKTETAEEGYILPGFIDAHVHIESSMLVPSEFARLAVVHGTVATVSDPHEIGNVLGMEGVRFMIENGKQVPFHFFFGAPSCVPATDFETAGAVIPPGEIEQLMADPDIWYLAEMMNYPGVISEDKQVWEKLRIAQASGKPIDGHAPGVRGEALAAYAKGGISTDHECISLGEALEKIGLGMQILIREGSAARNFEALIDLAKTHPKQCMFCSDDKHPDDLIEGHINRLVARAVAGGADLFDVLRMACINPILHYGLRVGRLRPGDSADFIRVKDLTGFEVLETWINGERVAHHGVSTIPRIPVNVLNHFKTSVKRPEDFALSLKKRLVRVIVAHDGELVTSEEVHEVPVHHDWAQSDPDRDVLKFTVVNRYGDVPLAVAFIKGFNLKEGAIASCVGHDSHNILAVGVSDESICSAVNAIIQNKGGIAVAKPDGVEVLPLPVAGIMSDDDGYEVAAAYANLDKQAKALGSTLRAPFMTLSFMALLVIPSLKLSDKGLFDGNIFQFVDVEVK